MNDLSIGECLREAGGLRVKDIQNGKKISNGSAGYNHSEVSAPPVYLGGNEAQKIPSKGDSWKTN